MNDAMFKIEKLQAVAQTMIDFNKAASKILSTDSPDDLKEMQLRTLAVHTFTRIEMIRCATKQVPP
jgi:hypothetical protein